MDLIGLHKSETMKWLCCILYLPSSHDSSRTITMNVAHRALQNNWIYLIFFNVVSQLKVIANIVVYESFCANYSFFLMSVVIVIIFLKLLFESLHLCLFLTPIDNLLPLEINPCWLNDTDPVPS